MTPLDTDTHAVLASAVHARIKMCRQNEAESLHQAMYTLDSRYVGGHMDNARYWGDKLDASIAAFSRLGDLCWADRIGVTA